MCVERREGKKGAVSPASLFKNKIYNWREPEMFTTIGG